MVAGISRQTLIILHVPCNFGWGNFLISSTTEFSN